MTSHVVIVTGSSSGIGTATARSFGATGDGVVVNSVRAVAEGEAVAAALDRWGRLDTLVNNAGTTAVQPLDVAEVVPALARAAYVTGQVVAIDGGLTIAL